MSVSAPMRRALLGSLLIGAVFTIALWTSLQVAIEPGRPSNTADAGADEEGRTAAQQAAGRVAILFGGCGSLAVAAVSMGLVARRERLFRMLAERIQGLDSVGLSSRPAPAAADRPLSPYLLLRRFAEAQASVQGRITKLENERRRGFHVLGHMTDGVVAVDADRRVLLLNPAARRLLRLNRESSPGRRLAEVVRVPQIVAAVDTVLMGSEADSIEFSFPSDSERFLKVQATPLPGDDALGALITIRDETQMRQLDQMRREFIANVSHELKTPLAAVKGYAETLQLGAKDDPDTCTHFLTQIGVQVERLERLISDMLQLARAQAGTENLTMAAVPVVPVLQESFTTYEPLARARQIRLEFQRPDTSPSVEADREALLTIANNLLGNAIRYTPEGGHVELRCTPVEEFWAISVSDNGIGIPEEDQQRIFERFYRVEKARDTSRGGTGLGLSIVKNLVQALGGQVQLQSRLGEGSTFTVLLRRAN